MQSSASVQRDLKPQNLLLSDNTPQAVLKIADFGFARHLQQQELADTLCGSPLYMAPRLTSGVWEPSCTSWSWVARPSTAATMLSCCKTLSGMKPRFQTRSLGI